MTRALISGAAAIAAILTLAPQDADACSYFYPSTQALHPGGTVAQSAHIFIEKTAGYGSIGTFLLTNEAGDAFEHTITEDGSLRDERTFSGQRFLLEPTTPLAPGTYTLTEVDASPDEVGFEPGSDDYQLTTTFTVTQDLPPEGAPLAPSLSWSAVAYDGPEDPPVFPPTDSCSPGADTTRVRYRVDVSAATAGYITVAGEDADGNERYRFDTLTEEAPAHVLTVADYEDDDLTQCISVTVTDLYGNTSEPTRSCKPDGCAARHRNDRDPIDWADLVTCEDWSPGFAERNAPGCACAQAPGAPAGSPAALGLLALGLFAMRRRL